MPLTLQEIQLVADRYKLDVRQANEYSVRLLDEYGELVADVYEKRHKKSKQFIANTVGVWYKNATTKWQIWYSTTSEEELLKVLKLKNMCNNREKETTQTNP